MSEKMLHDPKCRQNCLSIKEATPIQMRPKIPIPTIIPIVSLSGDRLDSVDSDAYASLVLLIYVVFVKVVVRRIRLRVKLH